MKIDKTKLDSLYNHVKGKGSSDIASVAKVLGVNASDVTSVDAYVDALMARNPELFNEPAEVKEEVTAETDEEPLKVFLKNENNIIEELEVLSHKNGKVVVEKRIERILVSLNIKGQSVQVDLLELERTASDAMLHGVRVEELVTAARIARA